MGFQRLSIGFYRGTAYDVPDDPQHEWPTCSGTGHKYWTYVKTCDEKWTNYNVLDAQQVPTGEKQWMKNYTREATGVPFNLEAQALIITVITLVATVSVITGLDFGISYLARAGFALSCFLISGCCLRETLSSK